MNWEITIKKVDNGYILSVPEEDSNGFKDGIEIKVINIRETVMEDKDKNNLKISWDLKGHKAEDDE